MTWRPRPRPSGGADAGASPQLVRPGHGLAGAAKGFRAVEPFGVDLDEDELAGPGGPGERGFELALGVNVEGKAAAEDLDKAMIFPGLDVVVRPVDDHALDRVAVVVQEEDDRLLAVADHGREVLAGDLERAVAHEQYDLAVRGGQACSQRGADGVADRAVEGLADELRPFRHQGLGGAEEGHSGLGDDHGAGLEEVADAIEEAADGERAVGLGNKLDRPPVGAAFGGPLDVQGQWVPPPELLRQPDDELAKRDVRVDMPLDLDRVEVGADRAFVGKPDGESAGVEVGGQAPSSSTQSAFSIRSRT